jgi:hypothetical protein
MTNDTITTTEDEDILYLDECIDTNIFDDEEEPYKGES